MVGLIILIVVVALVAGFVSGVFGGGAGLINVPGFYLLLSCYYANASHLMQVAIASGVSSSILLGILASRKQYKYRQVCNDTLKWVLPSVALGGVLGVLLMALISSGSLKVVFAIIVIAVAIWLICKLKKPPVVWQAPIFLKMIAAFFSGTCTMLSGVSVFFVPLLIKCGLGIKKAIGTSTVITVFICLIMSIFFIVIGLHANNLPPYSIGYLNLLFVLIPLIPSTIGALIGVKVTNVISHKYLQVIYILMMFIVAITMFF